MARLCEVSSLANRYAMEGPVAASNSCLSQLSVYFRYNLNGGMRFISGSPMGVRQVLYLALSRGQVWGDHKVAWLRCSITTSMLDRLQLPFPNAVSPAVTTNSIDICGHCLHPTAEPSYSLADISKFLNCLGQLAKICWCG